MEHNFIVGCSSSIDSQRKLTLLLQLKCREFSNFSWSFAKLLLITRFICNICHMAAPILLISLRL